MGVARGVYFKATFHTYEIFFLSGKISGWQTFPTILNERSSGAARLILNARKDVHKCV